LPLYFLGLPPEAVILVNLIVGVQGILSHSNLDLRAGWFNYIFVGPELHRYHHSADLKEAGNYAVALSVIDLLFGTFIYKPGQLPDRIGVGTPSDYPRSVEVWKVLLLPFLPRVGRRSR
jgi:sterol desaturase/sphingolipid hydroxylase (fatty acid hydroxylase superfamily)